MRLVGVSFASVLDGHEEHRYLTCSDGEFFVREPDAVEPVRTGAARLVQDVLQPFRAPGDAFFTIVDHAETVFDVGFVARRDDEQWVDVTCPDAPFPITWEAIDSECWAALARLLESDIDAARTRGHGSDS